MSHAPLLRRQRLLASPLQDHLAPTVVPFAPSRATPRRHPAHHQHWRQPLPSAARLSSPTHGFPHPDPMPPSSLTTLTNYAQVPTSSTPTHHFNVVKVDSDSPTVSNIEKPPRI
ncbi:hypothetical protein MKEN_00718000 [Mycena kentingensis (nom. inval.)]|nr:hypothetical protein MKEN_00718000 [Mycena kentingensis (nom. inval.)]